MTVIKNTATGRHNTDTSLYEKNVRKPVFVDNAIHFAKLDVTSGIQNKITIEKSNSNTFQIMPENEFEIVEGESNVQIIHKGVDGHTSLNSPYFINDKISSTNKPVLLYDSSNSKDRLTASTVESATHGVKLNLSNMKSRKLRDIGFNGNNVKLGQPIDVGLRTSDFAIKIVQTVSGGINSANIGRSLSSTANSTARKHHSTRFIGQDFHNVNIMTALRFLSRHDGRMVMVDRFGNLLYVPINFSESPYTINPNLRFGGQSADKITNTPNRVTVQGLPLSLNDNVVVTLDDTESQSGVNGEVREASGVITDMTVRSSLAARRVARQVLRSYSLEQGAIQSTGHYNLLPVRAGMAVNYGNRQYVVSEIKHNVTTKMSDVSLLSIDVGLEGILQGVEEGVVFESNTVSPSTYIQNKEENIAMFGSIKVNIYSSYRVREIGEDAFLIGGYPSRGVIGKNGLTIGTIKKQETRY